MSAYLSNANAILAWIRIDSWHHETKSILDTGYLMNVILLFRTGLETSD